MAVTVGILGQSGSGKSTSTVINPDGGFDLSNYKGLDFSKVIYFNCDKKMLPFASDKLKENVNFFETSDSNSITGIIKGVSEKGPNYNTIIIDTINGIN